MKTNTLTISVPASSSLRQVIVPCLGRAHGSNVAGKGSPAALVPDKFSDDDHLFMREYQWSEEVIDLICDRFDSAGLVYVRYIADNDYLEPGLSKRQEMINSAHYAMKAQGLLLYSHEHHVNAAGMGDKWLNATGVCVFTSKGNTRSDKIATLWWDFMKLRFPELVFRADFSDGDPDYEAGFYNLVTVPPAILTEWLFQDSKKDVEWLIKAENKQRYADAYYDFFIVLNGQVLEGRI